MFGESLKTSLSSSLSKRYGHEILITDSSSVSGGCINQCFRIQTSKGLFFIKLNSASMYPGMFEAESRGLKILKVSNTPYIPEVICLGQDGDMSFLVLEFVESAAQVDNFWEAFGKSLAKMHRRTSDYFGLDHSNYIGSLAQRNHPHSDWTSFFICERLEPQIKAAKDRGAMNTQTMSLFQKLFTALPDLFPPEPPALLHGDLWSGNYMTGPNGEPCIIDPAVYFGHREIDIGMSKLFGGFSNDFYRAYNAEYPMESGWEDRLDIANLYPLLVHVNLFGGGYISQVKTILQRFG